MNNVEFALTSDSFGLNAWNHTSGCTIKKWKGSSSAQRTLNTLGALGADCVVSGQAEKPILNIWRLSSKDQIQSIVCPGRVTATAVTPDGVFCAAGIGEKIHIWQLATGDLVAVLSKHYLQITCLKFTDDGTHLVSGANDGLVLAWSLYKLITSSHEDNLSVDPLHVWSHHSLPVSDLHVGCGGVMARVVSASADRTCKMYDLVSGQLLASLVFDVGLTAVAMDVAEMRLFAAGNDGRIFQMNLFGSIQTEDESTPVFDGHTKQVTSLAVSVDGSLLLSGSNDETAKVWHIESHHCLLTIPHKGPVSNAIFVPGVDEVTSKRPSTYPHLKRTVGYEAGRKVPVRVVDSEQQPVKHPTLQWEVESNNKNNNQEENINWKRKFAQLQATNQKMYEWIIEGQMDETLPTS